MDAWRQQLQDACRHLIDVFYFAFGHSTVSELLLRKPSSLVLEATTDAIQRRLRLEEVVSR